MKKTISFLLALTMAFCLAACGDTAKDPQKDPETEIRYTVVFNVPKPNKEDEFGTFDTYEFKDLKDGTVLGSPESLGITLPESLWGDPVTGDYAYYDIDSGRSVDLNEPIHSDMTIEVSAFTSGSPIIEPDPVDDTVHVTDLDVPNCKYFDNAYRYKLCMKPGDTFQLEVVLTPENAADKGVYYEDDNNNGVVSISDTGLVTALKYGSTMIHPYSHDGNHNVGIRTEVFGYEMKVSVRSTKGDNTIFTEGDVITLNVETTHYTYETKTSSNFPSNTYIEVVSGPKDLLKRYSYDPEALIVTRNPEKSETLQIRFCCEDEYGIHKSNIVEIPVYQWMQIN